MLYWSGYAVIFGYVSAYLSGKGLSNTMIGIVTAVVAIASTILQPLTASMIERGKKSALRNTIMVEALIFTVTDILLLAVHAFPLALIILLLFGGKKIPELMKGLGKGVRSFKDGINGKDEIEKKEDSTPTEAK